MAHVTPVMHTDQMPRSIRWLIASAYVVPAAAFSLSEVLPRGGDELGIANAMIAIALGMLIGAALLLVGLGRGVAALVRARGRLRRLDYLVLIAGAVPPLVVLAVVVLAH
jgi:hypothetical protein